MNPSAIAFRLCAFARTGSVTAAGRFVLLFRRRYLILPCEICDLQPPWRFGHHSSWSQHKMACLQSDFQVLPFNVTLKWIQFVAYGKQSQRTPFL
ncbi:hypothetical protein VNO77_28351 [Canavalia gladiata]|uniref:Uncharacterized protein n=1 Tax=Canavalia gladiata TaxID=3824 RepID=A0AAN9Q773_CANGL